MGRGQDDNEELELELESAKNTKTNQDIKQNRDIVDLVSRVTDVEDSISSLSEKTDGFKVLTEKFKDVEGKVDKFYSNFLTIIVTLIGLGAAFILIYSTVITIIPSVSEMLIQAKVGIREIILVYLLFINAVVMLSIVSFYIIMLLMNNLIYTANVKKISDLGLVKHLIVIFGFFVLIFILESVFIWLVFPVS